MATTDSGKLALLQRARAYPYDMPESCSALAGGRTLPLVGVDVGDAFGCEVVDDGSVQTLRAWAERHGVETGGEQAPELLLAYGSNASVDGLSRKLADCLQAAVLPIARATLAHFEVVYSAHIASYGAIPATLQYSPGARTTVFVLVTDPGQCRALRATEPNYHFTRLDNLELRLDLGPTLSSVAAVISRHGVLRLRGTEVGVAAVETRHRRFPALIQGQVMRAVRDLVAPGVDVDDFILENIHDPGLARRRTAVLRRMAGQFAYRDWVVIDSRPHAALPAGKA